MRHLPWYQSVGVGVLACVSSIVAVGALLDAFTNAKSLITRGVAEAVTVVLLAVVMGVHFVLRRRPARWRVVSGEVLISGLGPRTVFGVLGMLGLLWLPQLDSEPAREVYRVANRRDPQPPVVTSRLVVPPSLLLVDTSPSMVGTPTRRLVDEYVAAAPHTERVGLAVFASRMHLLLNPGRYPRMEYLRRMPRESSAPRNGRVSCTGLYASLSEAATFLSNHYTHSTRLIVFSDGVDQPCRDAFTESFQFEARYPRVQLRFVLLGQGDPVEVARLFPTATIDTTHLGNGGRRFVTPNEVP